MSLSHIIAACRSPVAPRGGALADCLPHDLASPVISDLLQRGGIQAEQVGELVLSNALGAGGNPARIAALAAGLPEPIAGLSVDRQCAGGLDAILLGDAMIRAGLHDVVIAGGAESYSRRPIRMHRFPDGRPPETYEQAPFTPWPDRDPDMATVADVLARSMGINREEQDTWAQASHAKALTAQDLLAREIVPVAGLARDSFTRVLSDRHCARARTVCGTISAANMAVAADGAAFVLMVSDRLARRHTGPSLTILGGRTLGADPTQPGLAPVPAVDAVLKEAQLRPAALSAVEIMEAFAVQAIACQRGSALPHEITNRHGGALARGHPIGASGAILAVRLFQDLTALGSGTGLAAIASAGGLGSALLLGA
ncbi:MAG: acetyl-CoA C-acyltransferase [Rhodobacteraceae bacterium]|nr:acetyl-CoA C-acyltransferase [Paracoccaceae bacterium]